ncbi:cupin domain-containing protein [Salinisphaera sp. Q1T1-3]|nr:cupin domain-containing protein [Salinisphaera sp. Q1T1-3]
MPAMAFDTLTFDDDGRTPNNAWPVVMHHAVLAASESAPAAALERLLAHHDWPPQWRGGVFDYHHYHSTAHEVLAVATGSARLQLGGEAGQQITIRAGDVVILPAGTGHCRIEASQDFLLVGGYPVGQPDWDLCRSGHADIEKARLRIAGVPCPQTDPVTGRDGGLRDIWLPA